MKLTSIAILILCTSSIAINAGQPIFEDIDSGYLTQLKLRIANHENVNVAKKDGTTPLHAAVARGSIDMVTLLLGAGANPEAKNHSGRTPLHIAVNLALSDDPKMYVPIIELLSLNHANIDATDKYGSTPLWDAAFNANYEVFKKLYELGADPRIQGPFGASVLHAAVSLRPATYRQSAALSKLELAERLKIVGFLIDHDFNVNVQDASGNTALHKSASKKHSAPIIKLLLGKGRANPTIPNKNGQLPLHTAVFFEDPTVVVALLDTHNGITRQQVSYTVNAQDTDGNTPLHFAASYKLADIIKALLAAGADTSIINNAGHPPALAGLIPDKVY